jgi:predicted esterase
MPDSIRHCTFPAKLDCHYLLHPPRVVDSQTLLVLTLHGFGQTPEAMLPLTTKMFGPQHAIASLEGPNEFFIDSMVRRVVFGWNTSTYPASSIRLHHDMVRHVLNEAGGEFGIPRERRILVGFSQSVALNYRFAATHPSEVRGVVAVCGGIPGDWETAPYQPITASVLHIARQMDSYYPPDVTEQYPAKLRLRVMDLEFHLIEGGHNFPSGGDAIARGWLERILR